MKDKLIYMIGGLVMFVVLLATTYMFTGQNDDPLVMEMTYTDVWKNGYRTGLEDGLGIEIKPRHIPQITETSHQTESFFNPPQDVDSDTVNTQDVKTFEPVTTVEAPTIQAAPVLSGPATYSTPQVSGYETQTTYQTQLVEQRVPVQTKVPVMTRQVTRYQTVQEQVPVQVTKTRMKTVMQPVQVPETYTETVMQTRTKQVPVVTTERIAAPVMPSAPMYAQQICTPAPVAVASVMQSCIPVAQQICESQESVYSIGTYAQSECVPDSFNQVSYSQPVYSQSTVQYSNPRPFATPFRSAVQQRPRIFSRGKFAKPAAGSGLCVD